MKQLAVNCLVGWVAGFGVAGYLLIFPGKDMKADPLTSLMVMALSFSSGAGAVVSVFELRRKND